MKPRKPVEATKQWLHQQGAVIWENTITKGLWKRILKVTIATTAANALMLIPQVESRIGKAAYLCGITTGFGHAGRRLGQMAEALVLVMIGTLLGLGWALLGVYLSSILIYTNPPAAYAVRGVFLAIAFLVHGFYRSHAPRLFLGTVLWIIINVVTLVSSAKVVTTSSATQILYPIFIAVGLLFLVNICVFPEFSSRFLGETTLDTAEELLKALKIATEYFLGDVPGEITKEQALKIDEVTTLKADARAKLAVCKAVQSECNFELAFSVLEPRQLKPISDIFMTKLTMNIIAMISACESKFALIGDVINIEDDMNSNDEESTKDVNSESDLEDDTSKANVAGASLLDAANDMDLIKPHREIEYGDPQLLRDLAGRIAVPCQRIRSILEDGLNGIKANVSYSYRLPQDTEVVPVNLTAVDKQIEEFRSAIDEFDTNIHNSLASSSGWKKGGKETLDDIIPREEIFLISSFYLNMRQAALHTCQMLEHSRELVENCQRRKSRRRIYMPQISWKKWLYSGGEEDQPTAEMGQLQATMHEKLSNTLDEDAEDATGHAAKQESKPRRTRDDPEFGTAHSTEVTPSRDRFGAVRQTRKSGHDDAEQSRGISRIRERLADAIEWIQRSDDVQYALKLCIASFLTVWPAFVAQWNQWYALNRGLWAALQLVLITEPTFGMAINTFVLRAVGTTAGCLWGWAAYGAGNGNRYVCGVMIAIGTVPAGYVLICTKYVKAGIVIIVSITVVALATELETVPGGATENFLKRYLAFTIGAVISLVVVVVIFPVKASTRLNEALTRCLRHTIEMQNCVAFGIEHPRAKHILTPATIKRFDQATAKAKAAVQTAEGLIPFAQKEPRLKGSFDMQLEVYNEIIFVMHQIVERMDNMIALRTAYGSGPLSRYNAQIYPYRRNLAGAIVLTLFSVQEALATKLPLPQFLPSCRLAQLRMINRVRDAVQEDSQWRTKTDPTFAVRRQTARTDWLSWNAGAMAQAEIVEYLEELVDLAKLLVGANEFRSGLLTRPTYREYVQKIERQDSTMSEKDIHPARSATTTSSMESMEKVATLPSQAGLRRRATTLNSFKDGQESDIPYALLRIQSRRQGANLKRQETWKSGKGIAKG